jgi:hypothetical protein
MLVEKVVFVFTSKAFYRPEIRGSVLKKSLLSCVVAQKERRNA